MVSPSSSRLVPYPGGMKEMHFRIAKLSFEGVSSPSTIFFHSLDINISLSGVLNSSISLRACNPFTIVYIYFFLYTLPSYRGIESFINVEKVT